MSKYTSSSYDRPPRTTYQSPRTTKSADVNTGRSYDSQSRKYDVTRTRSYDAPSRTSQQRSGQSSRSSSVSSTVSESPSRDTRLTSSSHIPSSTHSPSSVGTSSRYQSQYASSQARRELRSTSAEGSQTSRTGGDSVTIRQSRPERDEKSRSEVSPATSTESERKRFGYSSPRPVSHPSREIENGKTERSKVEPVGKTSALDLVAERFGGMGARRSLREKPDEDRSRFGSPVTRRSARNVSGEMTVKTKKEENKDLPSSKLSAPLRRTQKTIIPESTDNPVQLRGREIQKVGNIQVASRIESLTKSSQQDDSKERIGSGQLRRTLHETNGAGRVNDSEKTDRFQRNNRFGSDFQWHSKSQSVDKPSVGAVEQRKSYTEISSSSVDESATKKNEKSKENYGSSVLRRRMQKYTGQSKSSGAVDEILAVEQVQESQEIPSEHPKETHVDVPVQRSNTKVLPNQKSLERTGKTPADDFLRRAEMRSSLRQHSRDIAASAEQTLSGDVFKRSSLRSTLPLRKDLSEDSLERSEFRRSLRKTDTAPFETNTEIHSDQPPAEISDSVPVVHADVCEIQVQSSASTVQETEVEPKIPVIKTKVSMEAEGTDRFGRPTWRKALRGRSERPISGSSDTQTGPAENSCSVVGEVKVTEKLPENPQCHSTPIRSRIPKRSDSDSSAPDSHKPNTKATEFLQAKVTTTKSLINEPASGQSGQVEADPKAELTKSMDRLMPLNTPGNVSVDVSIGDSFTASPSESREDRIRRYKAERRKQLAHLTERFQESPLLKHFIKPDEPKEEKSKDGLLSETSRPQKLGESKMVLNFETQPNVVAQPKEANPSVDDSVFKRPRSIEEPEDAVFGLASKKPKTDEEEDSAVASPLVELKITESSPLASEDIIMPREVSPQPQLATLRYTMKDTTIVMPENVAKDLEREFEADLESGVVAEKSKVQDLSGKNSVEAVVNVERKIAEVKPFRQELTEATPSVQVSLPSQPLESKRTDVSPQPSQSEKAFVNPLVIQEREVTGARALGKGAFTLEESVQVTHRSDIKNSEEIKAKVGTTKETQQKETGKHITSQAKSDVGSKKITGNDSLGIKTTTTTTAKKLEEKTPQAIKKDVAGKKETKATSEPFTQKLSQGTEKEVPLETVAVTKKEMVTNTGQTTGRSETVAGNIDLEPVKRDPVRMTTELLSQKETDVQDKAIASVTIAKSEQDKPQPREEKKEKTAQKEVTSKKEVRAQLVQSIQEPVVSITEAAPKSPQKTPAKVQDENKSDLKTPVKTLQQQQTSATTPESPDNLDELLRRNQQYLEEEVKKKLIRQQQVVHSSSSEAEKAVEGSLVPPGGKKKRISPLMRRRIKERSKSKERAEAEKEQDKIEKEISAAELLASPEKPALGETTGDITAAKFPPFADVLDNSRKPTDSDSTLTSVADSVSVSVTGSEDHTKRKRKDKSSIRKSHLNVSESLDQATETITKPAVEGDLDTVGTPKGQRIPERTKTTPVTTEEVQQATEHIARQKEEVKGSTIPEETFPKSRHTSSKGFGVESTVERKLRLIGPLTSRVSSALSKFEVSKDSAKTETKPKTDDLSKTGKIFARGRDFSTLLSKFSSSDSAEETQQNRRAKVTTRKFDIPSSFTRPGTTSSDESNTEADRPRRTPERTGSLKIRAQQFEGGAAPKVPQRSASFKSDSNYKSDFMRRMKQQQHQQQSDKPSEELATALQSRNKPSPNNEEAKNVEVSKTESQIDILEAKLSAKKDDAKVEEVIKDQQLIEVLKSRRKLSDAKYQDALDDLSKLENGNGKSTETDIKDVIADEEVAKVLEERRKNTDSKQSNQDVDLFEDAVETLPSKLKQTNETKQGQAEGGKIVTEKSSRIKASQSVSTVETKAESRVAIVETSSKSKVVQNTKSIESKTESKSFVESRPKEIQKPSEYSDKAPSIVNKETEQQQKVDNSTTKQTGSSEERPKSSSASGSVTKQNSLDKPVRGILKRSSSSDQNTSGPIVDPQLAAILQGRKKMVENTSSQEEQTHEEDKRNVIRQEIAATEMHKGDEEEEEERPLSIAERIFVMENRIEEAKSCPVTPRSRSGYTTPRSRARSGASTPRRDSLESLEEEKPKTNPLLISDKCLMAKLEKMAEKEEKTDKRPRQPRRSRDSWRTRTMPITLEEIQEADSLESVSSFRGLVRRKATINIFEQLQEQDKRTIVNKKTEFPQPFRKEKKSRRSGRFKTAPITAAELGSIPEGNTMLDPLRHLYEPLSAATSKADSGILSGSDAERESVQSDSLRSLEMELPEDDPTRLSVSARTSIFKQLEEQAKAPEKEKPKNRSIGAKRMIEKKKRERSQTQPITVDEVKTASKIADTDKNKSSAEKTSGNKTVSKDGSSDSEDELSRLSLADRVKLFSQKAEDKKTPAPSRPTAPVLRKRKGKQASRFNTQPITPEEVERASKFSPLALSMAKPPDNELLRSLPIAAQIEMMAQHAEATLSQPSSRAGSRAGSQPSSRRSSVGAESVEADDSGILKTSENKDPQEVKSILKHEGRKSSDSEIRGILKDGGKDSSEPRGILKHGDSEGEITSPAKTPEEPSRGILKHTDSNDPQKSHRSALRRDPKGKSEGDLPRSILKRDSLEENKVEPDKGVLKKSRSQDFKESQEIRGILKKSSSSEVKSASCEVRSDDSDITAEFTAALNDAGDLDDSELHDSQINGAELTVEVTVEKSSESVETRKTSRIKNEAVARRRSRETRKAETERYRTQPADTGASEKTPEQRKMKYGASRHHTQPITPEEKEAAQAKGSEELSNRNSGSISERLNQLKKSGEEDWKRRIRPELALPEHVQIRVKKGPLIERPTSIADRLNKLDQSQQRWTARVEETDVKEFTVEGKQGKNGLPLDSPVSRRKRRLPKRELSFGKGDSAPSEDGSPIQSPSRERIPLPKDLISEGPPVLSMSKSSTSSRTVITKYGADEDREVEESFSSITVELPDLGEESFNTFFTKVEGVEEERVDVTLDDFDQLFLQAEDVLAPTRRIRPKRRHIAQNRNPLKTRSVEIQQEYTEFRTGVAEMELKRIKREGFARDSSTAQVMLAEAAVKGLQSTESFNIELRKTKDSKSQTPGGADKFLPYKDVMLLHIKGRRHVQTRLVEPCAGSVNKGDSYILVTPDRVVNWNGKLSNVIEKAKSADIAQFVSQRKDLGYRASSPAITVEDEKMRHVANKNFWSALGGNGESQDCGPPDEDEDYEAFIVETNMVYKVCNNTLVPYEEYWGKIPRMEMLKPKEVLVFDFGSELYVWHGHQVSMEQRKMGMKLATQLWDRGYDYSMCPVNPISGLQEEEEGGPPKKSSKRPSWAIFGKVNQNMETTLFKEKFFDWPESSRFAIRSKTPESFALKQVECDLKAYDAKLLIPVNTKPVTMMFEGSHVGRGDKWVEEMDGLRREFDILTLDVIVWHVLEYDHSKLPKHSYGQFHDGDTYVVRWQYMITASGLKSLKGHAARHSLTGRERCAYFFWQGHNSTVNEKGASALMTVELDEERGPQVRVSQGQEPPCFLNLFAGGTIVHIGKREEADTNTQGAYRLYLVRNELENEMCLMEVPVTTENLRSRTSLLLLNVKTGFLYIWHGAKSPSYTRKLAVGAANKLKEKCPLEVGLHSKASIMITELEEGSEKSEFWSALRSKDRKLYHSLLKDRSLHPQTPRLFYMNSVAGVFEAVEILNPCRCPDLYSPMPFLQSDLYKVSQPGLFLLDTGAEVYLWQGWWPEGDEDSENVLTGSAQARFNTDRRCAMETTIQYCQEKCPSKPVKAYLVFAGLEPLAFTNHFPSWFVEEEARESNLGDGRQTGEIISVEDVLAKLTQSQYTLEELQERPLPEGVDPLKLETYLREEEFEEVLAMSKDDFYALPGWKQTKLKQKVGLF